MLSIPEHYEAKVALVDTIVSKGKERADTMEGVVELISAEDRDILFRIVAEGRQCAYTIEGISRAVTEYYMLDVLQK